MDSCFFFDDIILRKFVSWMLVFFNDVNIFNDNFVYFWKGSKDNSFCFFIFISDYVNFVVFFYKY